MKARALTAAALVAVFAFTVSTGAAFAGKPDDPGKSGQAPGQVKKAEHAPEPAPAPQAHGGSEAKGKSASAPGKTKAGKAASPSKGKSVQAKARQETRVQQGDEPGRSGDAHHHVIVCHRTGSDSNPYVVINIPMTAWTEAHSPDTGSHPTLNGRDDILLKDPASRPGSKDGFTKQDCPQPAVHQAQQQQHEPQPAPQEAALQQQPAPEPAAGEVAGVQAVVKQPAAPAAQQPASGVLGALGSVGQAELPFTGLPLWIAALIGIALVSAGIGARRAMR